MLPLVVGGTTLFAACLLGIEAGIRAGAYRFLDAIRSRAAVNRVCRRKTART